MVYKKMLDLPGNEIHYSFDYGSAHFVVLDSVRRDFKTDQYAWLERDLEANRATHTFVFFHHPMYPSLDYHKNEVIDGDPGFQKKLHGLLVEHKVDIVFTGHVHAYHRGTHDGLMEVITGGAGSPLHTTDEAEGGFHHLVLIEVDGGKIEGSTLRIESEVQTVDRFEIVK
jgi:hypothetical protein